jgi:hypothetical protein
MDIEAIVLMIRARCADLGDDVLSWIEDKLTDDRLPGEIASQMLDVITEIDERLATIEAEAAR